METFYREATESTPEIHFDIKKNYFLIKGKSIFSDVDNIYLPAIEWLKMADGKLKGNIQFIFDLDYFNIVSSKRILFILYTLNDLRKNGADISIVWNFNLDDDDMKEVGEDYAYMVNVPFQFVCKSTTIELN